MSLTRNLQSLKLAALFGGIIGLGFGCVITVGPSEPCASGSNNHLNSQDECVCDFGYSFCDPDDISNLDCCEDLSSDGGTSDSGDGDGDTGDGDTGDGDTGDGDGDPGDGDGDSDCTPGELPPESCTPDEEGFYWCSNTEDMGPDCSQFFICEGGIWTENPGFMDESCGFDGFDFAYGCVDDGVSVIFECGDGSGAACDDADPAFCVDDDAIGYCLWGKETWDSCQLFCEEEGIEGQTYEYGECDASIPDDIACFCCDSGDPGCPI
ncbi:hypothetical protein ENSA5_04640 [Enhygromyxa salina]|uniref:Endo-1,4-beta-xylanase A n=1 Tax=Enhygromyxa salina TaxID=215803 RepID=A0A2S9YIN4_9BACT|nr:hypothetical protein [Enhygromyxa salina]PRQ04886.1 hypothetical protein ENSA5_04640 [Enhygromyxa salina]